MISFLIPFRDADGTRTPAKDWILARWQHFYPEAEFIVAPDDGVDPFCKSQAVNAAARQAKGDTFVILDADTWLDPESMGRGIERVSQGMAWVVPARRSLRLRKDVSDHLLRLDPTGVLPHIRVEHAESGHAAPVVGFLWILTRQAFEQVGGMDERFRGWGGEDTTFTLAMDRVAGRHMKMSGTLMCLWHARPRDARHNRVWIGQDRTKEQDKEALAQRYIKARSRASMLAVLSEAGGPLHQVAA